VFEHTHLLAVALVESWSHSYPLTACAGVIFLSVALLLRAQLHQIARNMTTNEAINGKRYTYLMDASKQFFNPFNKGAWDNVPHPAHNKLIFPVP
jgi:hypothetical protein